jgi:hypothetical protein
MRLGFNLLDLINPALGKWVVRANWRGFVIIVIIEDNARQFMQALTL